MNFNSFKPTNNKSHFYKESKFYNQNIMSLKDSIQNLNYIKNIVNQRNNKHNLVSNLLLEHKVHFEDKNYSSIKYIKKDCYQLTKYNSINFQLHNQLSNLFTKTQILKDNSSIKLRMNLLNNLQLNFGDIILKIRKIHFCNFNKQNFNRFDNHNFELVNPKGS